MNTYKLDISIKNTLLMLQYFSGFLGSCRYIDTSRTSVIVIVYSMQQQNRVVSV